jgi:very-short-patch-repair endonuclease
MADTKSHTKARNLRKKQTSAEQLLWSKLRSRGISGYKFRRQHPFEPYIIDFYCSEAHLAIEIDGGQHSEDEYHRRDVARSEFLEENGVRVIRFWNHEVIENLDEVLAEIAATLEEIMKRK